MRALALCCIFAVASVLGTTQQAAAQVGQSSVIFLLIEPDSRSAALGNTGVARADDANATFWNPAGLAFQRGTEVNFTHINWLPELSNDLALEQLYGKYHVDGIGTFGGQVTYFNLGEVEVRDTDGVQVDQYGAYEVAVGASYGVNLTDNLALGTGARFIYSKLAEGDVQGAEADAGNAFGADLGLLYRTDPFDLGGSESTFSAGFNLSNMGGTVTYIDPDQALPIPQNLRFGTALTVNFDEYNSLTITNDFRKILTNVEYEQQIEGTGANADTVSVPDVAPFYEAIFSSWGSTETDIDQDGEPETVGALDQVAIGGGLEYWYNQLFALRGGYYYENPNFGDRQFLTFGAGLRYNIVAIDLAFLYGLQESDPLSNTLRFSVGFQL